MGKASKLKKIRRLASQLPPVGTYAIIRGETMAGSALVAQGILEANGKVVNPNGVYVNKKKTVVALNHNRKMKRAFYKNGMQGAAGYATAIVNYAEQQNKPDEHNMPQ